MRREEGYHLPSDILTGRYVVMVSGWSVVGAMVRVRECVDGGSGANVTSLSAGYPDVDGVRLSSSLKNVQSSLEEIQSVRTD